MKAYLRPYRLSPDLLGLTYAVRHNTTSYTWPNLQNSKSVQLPKYPRSGAKENDIWVYTLEFNNLSSHRSSMYAAGLMCIILPVVVNPLLEPRQLQTGCGLQPWNSFSFPLTAGTDSPVS